MFDEYKDLVSEGCRGTDPVVTGFVAGGPRGLLQAKHFDLTNSLSAPPT